MSKRREPRTRYEVEFFPPRPEADRLVWRLARYLICRFLDHLAERPWERAGVFVCKRCNAVAQTWPLPSPPPGAEVVSKGRIWN